MGDLVLKGQMAMSMAWKRGSGSGVVEDLVGKRREQMDKGMWWNLRLWNSAGGNEVRRLADVISHCNLEFAAVAFEEV